MQTPEVPESLSFRVDLSTRWSDEDNQSVLNNAVYMTMFEEGRLAYFRDALRDNRFPFLLAQTNVRFYRPGTGGLTVTLEMGTTHTGRTSFVQHYRLRGPSQEVWAEAEALLVCYDPETGATREIPAELQAAISGREG